MRVLTGYAADSGVYSSTTSGILPRKGSSRYIIVSNHRSRRTQQVHHPAPYGDKIGDIVERYPELDVAVMQLTPANFGRYTNQTYFQAQAPRRLAEMTDIAPGTWFEVDGVSTGMLSLMYFGNSMEKPVRPPGHPHHEIPVHRWQNNTVVSVFGATNLQLIDGIRGAPPVEKESGLAAGSFHIAVGDWGSTLHLTTLLQKDGRLFRTVLFCFSSCFSSPSLAVSTHGSAFFKCHEREVTHGSSWLAAQPR